MLLPPPSPSPLPLVQRAACPGGKAALVHQGEGGGGGRGQAPLITRTELCPFASLLWGIFCCTCWAAQSTPWPSIMALQHLCTRVLHQYCSSISISTPAVLNQYSNHTPTSLQHHFNSTPPACQQYSNSAQPVHTGLPSLILHHYHWPSGLATLNFFLGTDLGCAC